MKSLFFLLALLIAAQAETTSPTLLKDLRCEGVTNPSTVGTPTPRLSWRLEGTGRGIFQKSFQILASSSAEKLAASEGDLWDSSDTPSNSSQHVLYSGKPLKNGQTVHWKVRIKDQNDQATAWSQPAKWTIKLDALKNKTVALYLKDAPRISAFECSDPTLTNLYTKAASVLPGVTSLRDIHLTLRGASYHQQLFPRSKEWFAALNAAVDEEGRYPAQLPTDGSFASTQSDAGILAAHSLYTISGNLSFLKDHWKTLNGYIHARKKHDPAFAGRSFGELPKDTLSKGDPMPESAVHLASHGLSLRIMKELARTAAETPFEEPMLLSALNNLQQTFKEVHLTKKGELKYPSIAGQLITLRYGLLAKPEDKKTVSAQLLKLLDAKKDVSPLSHGPLASAVALHVLTWIADIDRAITVAKEQKTDQLSPVALVNISEWLIWMVAGIDNAGAGFQNIRLTPYIPKKEVLSHAKAHLDTAYGRISSHWHYEDNGLAYDISLPANTQGIVKIPATEKQVLKEGGKELKEGNGILKIIRNPDHAEVILLSGSYQFLVAN